MKGKNERGEENLLDGEDESSKQRSRTGFHDSGISFYPGMEIQTPS